MTARLEQWRVKRRDTEEWMRHRQLPEDLQDRVRRFVQYKWVATRGVEEEEILRSLPLDLRRQIQRHLCLALVRRVSFSVSLLFCTFSKGNIAIIWSRAVFSILFCWLKLLCSLTFCVELLLLAIALRSSLWICSFALFIAHIFAPNNRVAHG